MDVVPSVKDSSTCEGDEIEVDNIESLLTDVVTDGARYFPPDIRMPCTVAMCSCLAGML